MRMKSYFTPTVEAALGQARRELGPEALLVSSRKAPPEAQELGEYEVVFAVLPEGGDERPLPAAARVETAQDPVLREVARLRSEIEEMSSALHAPASCWAAPAPEFAGVYTKLVETDFSVEIARKIVKQAHARLAADAPVPLGRKTMFEAQAVLCAVRAEVEALISVDAALGTPESTPVIALIGPPGCGKTSTLVKLAVRYGLACSRPVHLISADARRISAAEQLRTYAAIIGAGFDAVETPRSLQQTLAAHRDKGMILVDTPGYGPDDRDEAAELAHFLSRQPGIDIHLVAPASMRAVDLSRTVERFAMFTPAKLLFTRLDETSTLGALVTESARRGLPMSFLTAGQQIPEDIEPARAERLLEVILKPMPERILSAA